MSKKLFVGSLPNGVQGETLRAEFGKYGPVEDVYVKQGCEPGRQWAFVTMASHEAAQLAKDATDRVLMFQGCARPCDVMVAKNQGMGGAEPVPGGQIQMGGGGGGFLVAPEGYPAGLEGAPAGQGQPRKVFVGSLPEMITDADLRAEFGKYGTILDIHINNKPVEPSRQWCFITYGSSEQAQLAKMSADRQTIFPGCDKAVEVTLARHQGLYGQDSLTTDVHGLPVIAEAQTTSGAGPKKIFVGSLPMNVSREVLAAEFTKYGQVLDIHINYKNCEPGRNWAFITYASTEQANYAKEATDRVLLIPGGDRPCEVMLAKNQGKHGQDALMAAGQAPPIQGFAAAQAAAQQQVAAQQQLVAIQSAIPLGSPAVQPPPPPGPPPPSLTPWRMYKTAAGLPYYHNHTTGQTQWECPVDLQVPGQGAYGAAAVMAVPQVAHYSPY